MSINQPPQVLFFDVFGTVVEWRSCVTKALQDAAERVAREPGRTVTPDVRNIVSSMTTDDWQNIVEEWRKSYSQFTKSFDPSKGFTSVDQHHYESLLELLKQRNLESLFTDEERWDLALSWHKLEPWPDSVRGLERLNRKFRTCTLSNGNIALLEDLRRNGSLPFTDIASAEHFGAYKPSPKVYNGAARKFGVKPSQCAMVASHLGDLKAAKSQGFQTIYVERQREEAVLYEPEEEAQREGYVDMWIDLESKGLIEIARQFDMLPSIDLSI